MSRDSLLAALGRGSVVIDSSVVLSHLDGSDVFSAAATVVIDEHLPSGVDGVVSAITVTEVLVRPFGAGPGPVALVDGFLMATEGLRVRPVDHAVAREVARVRAATGLMTPDAIVVATAIVEDAAVIVSTDDRWRTALAGLSGPPLVHLAAHLPL